MTECELRRLTPGIYRVWWDSGGSSEAAIGMNRDGTVWMAPTNWVSPVTAVDPFEIIRVERLDLPEPYDPNYDPDIKNLTWDQVVATIPPGQREAFLLWWRNHPNFSHQFDWQKLIAEAWREGSLYTPEPPDAPSAGELRDAILEHPKLANDLRELILVRDHPAPGHLIIDRTDGDNVYHIERYAAREQVKAHEVVASNKDFGCNSRFFDADKLVQTPRGGPHGPVIWELRE